MAITSNEVLASTGKRTTNQAYNFYISFAEFPEIVEPALTGFQGIIHAREPKINIPSRMDYLEEDATPEGFSLQVLWQTITREILSGGRVGLLADVSQDDNVRIVPYSVENITNWQERPPRLGGGAAFVVIRELKRVAQEDDQGNRDEFATRQRRFWRELRLNDNLYQTRLWKDPETARVERTTGATTPAVLPATPASGEQGEPEVVKVDGQEWTTITLMGKTFDQIPFLSVNALDVGFDYGAVPILPMTRRAYSIYRLTADYRRSLYMKGDPQPYVAGIQPEDAPPRIGGETVWTFANSDAKPGDLDIDGRQSRTSLRASIRRVGSSSRPRSGPSLVRRSRCGCLLTRSR